MSIRLLAIELYRAQQNMDKLEKMLVEEPHAQSVEKQLAEARKEYNTIKKMFEARKNAANSSALTTRYYRGMK